MPKTIQKKINPESFEKILTGQKTYELRLADWKCQAGDTLVLNEIDPKTKQPTGRSLRRTLGWVGKMEGASYWPKDDVEKYGYQQIDLLK